LIRTRFHTVRVNYGLKKLSPQPVAARLLYPRFLPLASNVFAPLTQSPAHTTRNLPIACRTPTEQE